MTVGTDIYGMGCCHEVPYNTRAKSVQCTSRKALI